MTKRKITVVAETKLNEGAAYHASGDVWDPDGDGAQDLSEFAGRACYQSWGRPSAKTADNEGYIGHIIEVNHGSVLEHGTLTVYVEGVSRSLTHELVRHRHFSYSQLSQRFVTVHKTVHGEVVPFVVPPLYSRDERANAILSAAWDYAVHAYENLIEAGNQIVGDVPDMTPTSAAKKVREAARAVLPNMTPTAIVVTGNHRAWREFLLKRGTAGADVEICNMAIEMWYILRQREPNIYADIMADADGYLVSKHNR